MFGLYLYLRLLCYTRATRAWPLIYLEDVAEALAISQYIAFFGPSVLLMYLLWIICAFNSMASQANSILSNASTGCLCPNRRHVPPPPLNLIACFSLSQCSPLLADRTSGYIFTLFSIFRFHLIVLSSIRPFEMSPNAQQDMDAFVCVYPTGGPSKLAIQNSTLQHLTTDGGLPYLRIRFSDIASSRHGITFGSDPGCHVVIDDNDVNKRHFCLGINKSRQMMLYDWGSSNGTYVTYKEQRRYLRNYFKWIIGGHPVVKDWNPVIVEPGAMWRFTIVVSDYTAEAIFPTQFNEELEDAFKTLCSEPDKRTRLHTGLDEPTSDSIQLTRPLGKGSFGSVVHSFDVSTGQVLALKTPVIGTMVNYPAWVKEARIMEAIRHVCTPLPSTVLVTDYLPEKHCEAYSIRPF